MITKEIINKICHTSIDRGYVTTADLLKYGLNNDDIDTLIQNNTITQIQTDKYEISSLEVIYSYGIEKINERVIYRGLQCFERCHELNPKHKETNLQLLSFYVSEKQYENAYQILDSLYSIDDQEINKETNLYLYLMNLIEDVPQKYQEKVSNMKDEDLLQLNDSSRNEIINKILIGKYLPAIRQLNIMSAQNITLTNKVIKKLLSKIITYEQELSKELLKLSTEERYHDIEVILSKRRNTIFNECVLKLTKIIQNIIRTKEIPTITKSNTNDMFEAIDFNDFELALKLHKEHLEKHNVDNNNTINILLIKINKLIESMKKQNNKVTSKETTINISELILELLQNNIERFIELLKVYLKQTRKEEYEYLITQLIKVSTLEKDNTFLKPITILTELSNNSYTFNISNYLQTFYQYLSQNKLSESRIILEIIKRYYHDSQVVIDNLNSALEQKEKQLELASSEEYFTKEETESIQPTRNNATEEIREMLTRAIYSMKENGEILTILPSIPYKTRIIIHSLVNEIDGIRVFSIGKEPKAMVLRLTKKHHEEIIYKEVIDELFLANNEKRYNRCLEIINILLQDDNFNPLEQEKPKILFNTIGHIYLMLTNHKEAIKYLTIVTTMNKQSKDYQKKYDHSLLILDLIKLSKPTELEVQMNQELARTKPHSDTIATFKLQDLEKLVHNIDENIITSKEAIDKFNLTEEQILLIKLIRARNFYIDKMPHMGDRLVKEVERTKNKTLPVIYFLDEIKNNKKLYSNRFERYTKNKKK